MRPKRHLGQNFLIDRNVARKIIACLDPQPGERVLEIGPGRGALSGLLHQSGAELIAVERDAALASALARDFPGCSLIVADGLTIDWKRLNGRVDKVIGNLPYNIASPLLWDMLPCLDRAQGLVFTVQKEVARRIVSSPGSKAYGALSVWLQSFAEIRYEFEIGPQVFRPRPRVDSAVVSMRPYPKDRRVQDERMLAELIHRCFQQRRKQLKTILKSWWNAGLDRWLAKEGLSRQARPEILSPEQFARMAALVKRGKQGENSD